MNHLGAKHTPFLFIIDFTGSRPVVLPLDEINPEEILYDLEGYTNAGTTTQFPDRFSFEISTAIAFDTYAERFAMIMNELMAGNTYLLNLTFPCNIKSSLSLQQMFHSVRSKYRLWMNGQFVCFSPETFVKIREGKIYSCPMKGTISSDIENAESIILNDAKELAEHYTIVDLIRNDLSMVAENVRVERFRYTDHIQTHRGGLLQVSSEISGDLPANYHGRMGEIICSMLPAGSVSGAPKKKTVEIIQKAEGYNRGYYTGVFGVSDGYSLNSAVLIRFVEQQDNQLIFKSGGGITLMSKPEAEYNELLQKVYLPLLAQAGA